MGIFGVILGIVGIAAALLATFLFGTTGGIIAGVIGAIAIVLGLLKRKNEGKGGIPAMVIGVLAIILAIVLTGTWASLFRNTHDLALKYKPDGLWAKVTEDPNGGIMGIISRLPEDIRNNEASLNAFVQEIDELNKLSEANK